MKLLAKAWGAWAGLFEEEGDDEPRFDPVHLATVLVAVLATVGALFWLLWALMVYEGGWGSGEGRLINLAALAALLGVAEALRRADRPGRSGKK